MDYSILCELVRAILEEHPSWSDDQIAAALNAPTETQTISRFGSFRTLMAILTPEEYAALKGLLTAAASQNILVADAVEMLKLPGDELGNGGGIDFGVPGVRAIIDMLVANGLPSSIRDKIVAYSSQMVSPTQKAGLPEIYAAHVTCAREQGV
jgi:hypothetical protein